jgi:hypothetical protein
MASQLENRMRSIKLQSVHCPGNSGVKVTLEGQGQPNLTVLVSHMEEYKLSKKVNDQPKIR